MSGNGHRGGSALYREGSHRGNHGRGRILF
jgi:hypothetical protein